MSFLGCFALIAHAETESSSLNCYRALHVPFTTPPESESRQYAPDREIDLVHLALDVTPDFKRRTVSGLATLTFKPIAKPLRELRLDAIDLAVQSVDSAEKIQNFQTTDDHLIITFANEIPPDKEMQVKIRYSAEPQQGLYFRTPEMGYKPGDEHCFTQGEAVEARHWYPCFDSPNEKFTSEITCRVAEGMTVLSNGKLVSEEKDAKTGLIAVRWLQEKPHVNYLVALAAGYFKKLEDKHKDVPLAFYTPPSQIEYAQNSFRDTKDIMEFFESEIGVPYPWAKYFQVVVDDFVAGGMENTSLTILTDRTFFTSATENIRNSEGLTSHEMAHQWFGDLVTCKDWTHLWLNEGFATYYALLYDGHKNGRDSMQYGLMQTMRGLFAVTNDTKAIVHRKYDKPDDQFNYLAYPKGGFVLQMLRSQLGEDLYRRCIKTYLERHQFGNVVTEALAHVVEELSGRSYDQFFDQWLYHAHYPELEVNYTWDDKTKLAKISVKQTQKISEDVLLFNFPLTIAFKTKTGRVEKTVTVKEKEEDFYFPLPSAPEVVLLNPDLQILVKLDFKNVSTAMLHAQLEDSNVVGRMFAAANLGDKKDKETVAKLKSALNHDKFFGVRLEAAKALQTIHNDESLEALLDSTKQNDARVRNQVAASIAAFYATNAYELERTALKTEKNPDILASHLRGLGNYAKPEIRDALVPLLRSESFRNSIADSAISAMRIQDDPFYVTPIRDALKQRESEFMSRNFATHCDTLAYLARHQEKKDDVRNLLLSHVNSKKKDIQLGAIRALGTLEDEKAMAVLQTFANASKETPERDAAEKSLEKIRAARKPTDNLKELRDVVLELQKQNRETKKEIEKLKKEREAKSIPSFRSPKTSRR